ncbi:MAG: hypothetical protein K0R92_1531 [Lachnospiraceae bacterium]|jgi:hypothetical protein|nr:hypothetical protein [Lachnospiraceae bacterium]
MSDLNINLCQIKDYIEYLARKSRVNYFYPQTISRKLYIPIDLIVIELSKLVNDGVIELRYEIRCSDDLNIIDTLDNYDDLFNKKVHCEICGDEIEISYNNIYPVYYINPTYKDYVKKKS